ncbi:MAG: tetraacyldisaccharide 4'-kinase [Ferruginibacter sp.]
MLPSFRFLLFPFSLLYAGVLRIRNWMYDRGWIRAAHFQFPVICIGNLSVGGTGKTPMTEWIIRALKDQYPMAVLSRGYKRRTKGFAIATEGNTASDIGDEPMQLFTKFSDITVAVGEERIVAIPQLLYQRPETRVLLLDDAFQHRAVKAGLNILLTDYNNLYTRDFVLPAGDLRDNRSSARRADIIIVTKCPEDLSSVSAAALADELALEPHQQLFFSTLRYSKPLHLFQREKEMNINDWKEGILVCGIANPKPIIQYLNKTSMHYNMMRFEDHHHFSISDLESIQRQFHQIPDDSKCILTTEKDAVRLEKYRDVLESYPIYVIPVQHQILFEQSASFLCLLTSYIQTHTVKPAVA